MRGVEEAGEGELFAAALFYLTFLGGFCLIIFHVFYFPFCFVLRIAGGLKFSLAQPSYLVGKALALLI